MEGLTSKTQLKLIGIVTNDKPKAMVMRMPNLIIEKGLKPNI